MPVTIFSRQSLWPKSTHNWMAPGAVQSTAAAFGPGLDYGALRTRAFWEILVPRTPTPADQRNSEWIPFEPKNPQHMLAASAFNRYGPGWSYGPGHNMHDEVVEYFREVNGRLPTDMEKLDIEHDKGDYQALLKAYQDKIGFTPGTGTGTTGTGTTGTGTTGTGTTGSGTTGSGTTGTQPQVPGLPPLSPPEQRAAELLSLLPAFLQQPWMRPLVVEAVLAWRRGVERVAQRVVELGGKRP